MGIDGKVTSEGTVIVVGVSPVVVVVAVDESVVVGVVVVVVLVVDEAVLDGVVDDVVGGGLVSVVVVAEAIGAALVAEDSTVVVLVASGVVEVLDGVVVEVDRPASWLVRWMAPQASKASTTAVSAPPPINATGRWYHGSDGGSTGFGGRSAGSA